MKSSTLIAVLVRLTTTMAAVAPIVIFGFLYVLAVGPQRAAAGAAQDRLAEARAELGRQRAFVRRVPNVIQVSAAGQFDSRTTDTDTAGEVAHALDALLNGPAVGGVADLAIETGAPVEGSLDPRIGLFGRQLVATPVTMSFDARYDQIGRFFWNLRVLPTTFELRSVELTPGSASAMHASVVLFVVYRKAPGQPQMRQAPPLTADLSSAPEWKRNPFTATPERSSTASARPERVRPPDPVPVVSSILFSSGRRVALIDGRIVRAGDRVGSAMVRSIEADSVVLVTAEGRERRVELDRPVFGVARR